MTDVCTGCDRAIRKGEARYTGREPNQCWHYVCHETVVKKGQPKLNEYVIQMEVYGLGGNGWTDLSVVPAGGANEIAAVETAKQLKRTKKDKNFRVIKVAYVD